MKAGFLLQGWRQWWKREQASQDILWRYMQTQSSTRASALIPTDPLNVSPAQAQMVREYINQSRPSIEGEPTQRLSSMSGFHSALARQNIKIPQFMEYRRADESVLAMLSSALLASVHKFGRKADALFLSSKRLEQLIEECNVVYGRGFDGHVYFATSLKEVEAIPVFTEELLPDMLRLALDGEISRDSVIAICE